MPKAKYQFDDFLTTVTNDCKGLVTAVHEMLLRDNYKPKIQVTKSTGLQLSYHQPKIKTTRGIILIFFHRNEKLLIRICGSHYQSYPDVLERLPKSIVRQISQADNCVKFIDPQKCWKGCIGYDFHIGGKHYQKCAINGFQFDVNAENMPYFLEIIKSENRERSKASVIR
ncbi:MAG: hypothetical protein FWE05_08815 [Defluviitaleaceae bacterium]|nr:hypothetical protein [Defluviitaleaceae bacterium]